MRQEGVITEARFETLYREQRSSLVRLAHLMTGSPAVAEELAQEALLATQQRWEHLDNPGGYARRALVNLCRSHQRRRILERRHATVPLAHALPPEIDETWQAIRRLTPDQRAVIVLRFYDDQTFEQIADLLDKPVGTVKSLQHRALARLKEVLA
ncbi:MAG TPA: SigE family RNA polymerase sigma factor [Acidimicrobiales bacterium]|nr:SigE family RNA polymerase sigma factor [Acidimicrobiales bacterium]